MSLGRASRCPPTGKAVHFGGVNIFRLVNGKVVEGLGLS